MISKIWYLITGPNMNKINPFFFEMSQQTHKMYEKMAIIILKFGTGQMLLHADHGPDHGIKYEENPASHHGGMCEDRPVYIH